MQETLFDPYDFTNNALKTLHSVMDSFHKAGDNPISEIYCQLKQNLKIVPFCEYLKRYLYRKAELTDPIDEVPLSEYRDILCGSFAETATPASFTPTTAKLSALSKNWLTQKAVRRQVVLLLGFGLRMTEDDVDDFLTRAIREPRLNPKDPFEAACWYCYRNGLGYPAFRRLLAQKQEASAPSAGHVPAVPADGESTSVRRSRMETVGSEKELIAYLAELRNRKAESVFGGTARKAFEQLYGRAREIITEQYNLTAEEEHAEKLRLYREKLANNDRMYDYEKQERIRRLQQTRKIVSPESITPSDVEHILYSSVPTDPYGNLLNGNASSLCSLFEGKRLTRQRIGQLLTGSAAVDRYDLLTLRFYLFTQETDGAADAKQQFASFVKSANKLLTECSMGKLCVSNPYEYFLLVCVTSDDPLGMFNDLWKASYEDV